MLHTRIYRMNTADMALQTAHVFEHAVILGLYEWLHQRGVVTDMIMWLSGEAYDERIFLEGGFYTKELALLCDEYFSAVPSLSDELVDRALAEIGAEHRTDVTVSDRALLRKQLDILTARPWSSDKPAKLAAEKIEIVKEKRAAKHYRDITVETLAKDLTPDEQKVFLRLRILVIDIVLNTIEAAVAPQYPRGTSRVLRRDDTFGYVTIYTVRRGVVTARELCAQMEQALKDYDRSRAWRQADAHRKAYAKQGLWESAAMTFYSSTGVDTSIQEIADLMTPERVRSVLEKVRFAVHETHPAEYNLLD